MVYEKYNRNHDNKMSYLDFYDMLLPSSHVHSRYTYLDIEPSVETCYMFKQLLKDIISSEKEIENIRLCLKRDPDFNVYNAFRMLDVNNKGKLHMKEVSNYKNIVIKLSRKKIYRGGQ